MTSCSCKNSCQSFEATLPLTHPPEVELDILQLGGWDLLHLPHLSMSSMLGSDPYVLGLLDPDPLVRDTDPVPSIFKQI